MLFEGTVPSDMPTYLMQDIFFHPAVNCRRLAGGDAPKKVLSLSRELTYSTPKVNFLVLSAPAPTALPARRISSQ